MQVAQKQKFQPIVLTVTTNEEAVALWDIVRAYAGDNPAAKKLAEQLSNEFSNNLTLVKK